MFHPAVRLLSRMSYARKILLIALVIPLPLGLATLGYVDIQRDQVAFSAKERVGVAYLDPLLDLTARATAARHAVVAGADPGSAGVPAGIAAVDAVDARLGAELETSKVWAAAKAGLGKAAEANDAKEGYDAYNKALDGLLGLIVLVSDKSNLTLDPDLDSYYLMDALVFRLPVLLDLSGRTADLARLTTAADSNAKQIDLAVDGGALSSARSAVAAGMTTSFEKTSSTSLPAAQSKVAAALEATGTLLDQVTGAARTGKLTLVSGDASAHSRGAITALADVLLVELDKLLVTRIGGFETKAYRMGAGVIAAVLLLAYLLVGLHRAATRPLHSMVTALEALARGDLSREVDVDTRDEVGRMADALNRALGNLRDLVGSLAATAAATSSAQLESVTSQLRSNAEATATGAATLDAVANEVSASISAIAAGTGQIDASIREIARSTTEAASVTADAVAVTARTNDTMEELSTRCGEIGAMVNVITAIAAQTNLLALNATIEAARAGEAGRGFAVVAGEVKDLAEETTRATVEITKRIAAIQAGTSDAVVAMEQINKIVRHVSTLQVAVAAAVEEQTATTAEITRSVSETTGGSDRMTRAVTEVAANAERAMAAAIDSQSAAEDLSRTASQIGTMVGRFNA